MAEELKIRIKGYKKIEKKLKQLGARYTGEVSVVDTYFNQPSGRVLKITEDDKGDFLVELEKEAGKFQILKYDKIDNVLVLKRKLKNQFGIKTVLKKKRRFFDFGKFMVNINLINNIGEFLIVEGENPTKDIITEKIGIKNPEYVTVPFSDLAQKTQEIFVK